MKPSKFNIYIKLPDNEILIFNSFSDSRVIVDEEFLNIIKGCSKSTDKSRMSQLLELKELCILIESEMNEDREVEYWFQKMKFDSTILIATILTTLAIGYQISLFGIYTLQSHIHDFGVRQEERAT